MAQRMLCLPAGGNPPGDGGERKQHMRRDFLLQPRAVQLAFVAVAGAAWFAIGRSGAISPLFLPPIEAVAATFTALIQTNEFRNAVAVTLSTIAQAYAIAVVAGIAAGYAIT